MTLLADPTALSLLDDEDEALMEELRKRRDREQGGGTLMTGSSMQGKPLLAQNILPSAGGV